MKKLTFYDIFLMVTVLIAFGSKWNLYSSILVITGAILELINVVPQISRKLKSERKDKKIYF